MAKHSPKRKQAKLPTSWDLSSLPKLKLFSAGKNGKLHYTRELDLRDMGILIAGVLLFVIALLLPVPAWARTMGLGLSALCAAFAVLRQILFDAFDGHLPLEELVIVAAAILGFAIGEPVAATIGLILYRFVYYAQAYAKARSDAAVDLVRDSLPEKAHVERDGEILRIVPEAVEIGDILLLDVQEALALDGVIVEGLSEMNTSALTGNDLPKSVTVGDEVLAGYRNLSGKLRVRVTRSFEDSAAPKLLRTVVGAAEQETKTAILSHRIAGIYRIALPCFGFLMVLLLSLGGVEIREALRRALIVLFLAGPSSLVIASDLGYLGACLSALRQGILLKSQACMEKLAKTEVMIFGKTGTITEGRYVVTEVFPATGIGEEQLLQVAAAAESHSRHPIALCLRRAAKLPAEMIEGVMDVQETPGRGISAFIEGRMVYVGNAAHLEEHNVWCDTPLRSGAAIHVAVENRYWGYIMLSDSLRDGAFDALESLRAMGVKDLIMLTGDVQSVSRQLAQSMNFDKIRAELRPADKLSYIRSVRGGLADSGFLGYVGDGINDAPMMKESDYGVAINALDTWEASSEADVAILDDEIHMLPAVMRISEQMERIALVDLLVWCGSKALLLILGLTGVLPVAGAVLVDAAVSVFILYNALRGYDLE